MQTVCQAVSRLLNSNHGCVLWRPVYLAAVFAAALLTVITRRPLLSMVSGVAVAAILRAYVWPT